MLRLRATVAVAGSHAHGAIAARPSPTAARPGRRRGMGPRPSDSAPPAARQSSTISMADDAGTNSRRRPSPCESASPAQTDRDGDTTDVTEAFKSASRRRSGD